MNKTRIYCLLLCSVLSVATLVAQNRAEYFIDHDPGFRNATKVSINTDAAQVDVPTSGLAAGWHILGLRALSSRTSQTYTHRFFIPEQTQVTALSDVEYFVDSDPGQNNAIKVPFTVGQTAFSFDLTNTDTLTDGIHLLGARIKYGSRWSQTYTHLFFVTHASTATELNAAEYWMDTDPGHGEAIPLAVSAGQSEISLDVMQIDTLSEGYHTFGVRVRYGNVWSQTYTHRLLHTVKQVVKTHIEAVEAYWDDNTEQVFAIPFVQQGDSAIIEGYDFDTKALTYGLHYLYLYAKANGVMSIITRYEVCKNAIPQFSILDEDALCVGDEVIIIDESTEVQSETTYAWDMNGDGKAEYTTKGDLIHTFTKAGRYTVTLTVQTGNGCESTYSREVYVHTKNAPSVSLSRTKSKICAGESVTFTATPTNGGEHPLYTWYRNDQVIEGATEAQLTMDDLQNGDKVKVQLTANNPCATVNTAMSSELTQTVNPLPEIQLLFAETYYTDGNTFSLTSLATPTGGTFYINDVEAKLFNPKNNPVGIYTVRYVAKNSNGCTAEAETTFELKERTNVTITVLSSNETMGSVSGGGICLEGTTVTLTATAKTGYHFVEWQDGVTTATREITVKSDATYTATFAIDEHFVSFVDWDESVLKVDTVEYGSAATAPADPTRERYSFIGWDKDFSNITADMTVTAQYEINKYDVQFLNWDGSELQNTQVIEGEMPTYTGVTPTRAATAEYTYTFAGWTPAVGAVTGNATYRATFNVTKNSYTITWQNEDGSLIDQTTVEYGVVPTHADPTKTATAEYTYTFAGWTPAVVAVTGNATYRATFNATKNSYTITWQNEDGTLINQTTVEYGVVPTHADPVKANTAEYTYTFAGWTPNVVAVTGNATYRATFNATKNSYTITWQNEDGTLIDQTTVEYGVVPTHADPVKANTAEYTYTFAGWTPNVVAVTGNATYRATYNAAKNKYLIVFKNDDDTELQRSEVESGTSPIAPTNPTKTSTAQYDYTFNGWSPAVTTVTQAATYTATYTSTIRSYTVKFLNEDGSEISSIVYQYGQTPVAPAEPTKTATAEYTYTFAGWDKPIAQVQGDQIYRATFNATKNKYTITWQNEDGTLIDQTTVEYGVVPTHADPVKANTAEYTYTFAGWTPNVVAVTGNATYRATYNAAKNKYLIVFRNDDGTELKRDEVEYGTMPIAPTNPTKESTAQYNYTFNGWSPAVTVVTQAATYTATYTSSIRSYLVTFVNDDNSVISMQAYKYGEFPTLPATPTKTATAEYTFAFAGWTPTIASVTGEVTYKATFNATKNKYTITWQNEDGTLIDQTTVEYGVVPTHADPVKVNTAEYTYIFAGWTPNVVAVTGNAAYTATFSSVLNTYTITFEVKENPTMSYSIDHVPYGTLVNDLVDQVKTALGGETFEDEDYIYTFAGLEGVTSTDIVTGDKTYYVLYTKEEKIPLALDNADCIIPAQKILRDGLFYILRDGKMYTLTGQEVK